LGWAIVLGLPELLALPALLAISVGGMCVTLRAGSARTLRRVRRYAPELASWAALSLLACVFATSHPAKVPALPDGPYVYKQWNWPVQVQYSALDLPADNVIPYYAGEFLARDIPFEEHRPLLPGQEVSNRTLLSPLIFVTFRAATHQSTAAPPVGTFDYLGTSWPDASDLYRRQTFEVFLASSIALNALVPVGCLLLCRVGVPLLRRRHVDVVRPEPHPVTLAALGLVIATTPFWVQQTFFTWPKNLAIFLILVALSLADDSRKALALSGLAMGLAYQAHPLALIPAVGVFGMLLLGRAVRWPGLAAYGTAFVVTVMPWIVYTRLVLHIPSDLLKQNLAVRQPLADHIAARAANAYTGLAPTWLDTYPFVVRTFLQRYCVSAVSIVGVVLLAGWAVRAIERERDDVEARREIRTWLCFLVITVGLLLASFSRPNVVMFHGGQISCVVLLAVLIRVTTRSAARNARLQRLLAAQCALNAGVLAVWWLSVT
jgi:hypothetical protein